MEVTTRECDICGKIVRDNNYNYPEGWYRLARTKRMAGELAKTKGTIGEKEDFWASTRDICASCAKGIGLDKICDEKVDEWKKLNGE